MFTILADRQAADRRSAHSNRSERAYFSSNPGSFFATATFFSVT
jgi:hypothetical protein